MHHVSLSQATATDVHYALAHASDAAEKITDMLDTADGTVDIDAALEALHGLGALIRVAMRSLN